MKAAICREVAKELTIEEVHLADPNAGEVRVRLKVSAICHSDIMFIDGGWDDHLPAVYGHEAAGIIENVGSGVLDISVGDHVVVTLVRSCGTCHYCASNSRIMCESSTSLDETSPILDKNKLPLTHGLRTAAFSEEVVVDASQVCRIPHEIEFESACLLACGVLTGFGAVTKTAQVPKGASAVIIGCGGVGLNAIQGAVYVGAAPIIALDTVAEKLLVAEKFGATHQIDASASNAIDLVKEVTGGRGADYVFVTVGAKRAIDQSLEMLAKSGKVVIVGMPASNVVCDYDPSTLASLGQSIVGSKMGSADIRNDIPFLISLYQQDKLKLDELISGRFSLDDINLAIDGVRQGTALRNVVVFP